MHGGRGRNAQALGSHPEWTTSTALRDFLWQRFVRYLMKGPLVEFQRLSNEQM